MKLLFLIRSLGGGGAEKVLIDILKNIDNDKFDITVCTIVNEGIYRDELPDYVHYRSIIKKPGRCKWAIFWRMLKWLPPWLTYKLFIRGKYDVEIGFLEGFSTQLLAGSTCKKKIAWVHTDVVENDNFSVYYPSEKAQRNTYKSFNKVVFVSTLALNQFKKRFGDLVNGEVIYNFIDKPQIQTKSEEKVSFPENDENVPVICSVGRLAEVKGYKRLLQAHKRLINEGVLHKIWLLGTGEEEENLKSYCQENGLNETVRFLGFQSNPYPYVRQSDIYVCSSFAEGYPLSVAEALVLEKPIIATNCTGPSEILNNGEYGLLVENSEDGIYDGLRRILTDKEFFSELKEKSHIGAVRFAPEVIISKIEDLITTL